MPAYIALLRAVNVSGRNAIAMDDLRRSFAAMGCSDVTTYIQSGNVVFRSAVSDEARLAKSIESRIAADFGYGVRALLRSKAQLARIHRTNPFLAAKADAAALHVTFLSVAPTAAQIRSLAARETGPDRCEVIGREVFLHCPGGYGRTKLNNGFFEKRLGSAATTRNWKTVGKLLEMLSE
jgi:uncharacterized protein (DUF1697 family)